MTLYNPLIILNFRNVFMFYEEYVYVKVPKNGVLFLEIAISFNLTKASRMI